MAENRSASSSKKRQPPITFDNDCASSNSNSHNVNNINVVGPRPSKFRKKGTAHLLGTTPQSADSTSPLQRSNHHHQHPSHLQAPSPFTTSVSSSAGSPHICSGASHDTSGRHLLGTTPPGAVSTSPLDRHHHHHHYYHHHHQSPSPFATSVSSSAGSSHIFSGASHDDLEQISSIAKSNLSTNDEDSDINAPTNSSNKPLYNNVEDLMRFFGFQSVFLPLDKLMECDTSNEVASVLKKRYAEILQTKVGDDAKSYLDGAHKTRTQLAALINNIKRDNGELKGTPFVTNLGNLPKTVDGLLARNGYWILHYATLACVEYNDGDNEQDKMFPKNPVITWCQKTIATLLAKEFMDEHPENYVQSNGNAMNVSFHDLTPCCLDKGKYSGYYQVDLNMLVRGLKVDTVLDRPKKEGLQCGRRILYVAGVLSVVEAITAKRLACPNDVDKPNIMVSGSNPRAALGGKSNNNPGVVTFESAHPECYLKHKTHINSGHFTVENSSEYDSSFKQFLVDKVRIFDHEHMDSDTREKLQNHTVTLTSRFLNRDLSDDEMALLSRGRYKRKTTFGNSTECVVLYHPDHNVAHVIGNEQSSQQYTSKKWGGQVIVRSEFGTIHLEKVVDNFDDGYDLEVRLNEALVGLATRSTAERITELKGLGLGVVSYTEADGHQRSGRYRRKTTFGNSTECVVLYHPDHNVAHVIGNEQSSQQYTSKKWGGQVIVRSEFGTIHLEKVVDNFDDGYDLEVRLNEALVGLATRSTAERITELKGLGLGVVSYTEADGHQRSGRYKRKIAFGNSTECVVLFHPDHNVAYVIGNEQTTQQYKSKKWGGQEIVRSEFGTIHLEKVVDNFDDGYDLEVRLNEALVGLATRSTAERITELKGLGLGVVSYTEADGRRSRRKIAFGNSTECVVLYHPDHNVAHVIGNEQTTQQYTSKKWGGQKKVRSEFGTIHLEKVVDNFDDGYDLEVRLNEALVGLATRSTAERIAELKGLGLGVVSYTEADGNRKTAFESHLEEVIKIAEKEDNWKLIDVSGQKVSVLLIVNHNSSSSLHQYFTRKFGKVTEEELMNHEAWEKIKKYNWQHHSHAKQLFQDEVNANKRNKVVGNSLSMSQKEQQILASWENLMPKSKSKKSKSKK